MTTQAEMYKDQSLSLHKANMYQAKIIARLQIQRNHWIKMSLGPTNSEKTIKLQDSELYGILDEHTTHGNGD